MAGKPEKTFTLELTKQEGAIVWEVLAEKAKAPHPAPTAHEAATVQTVMLKINKAARDAGMSVFDKDKEPKVT
jgi:hypothetical protein